MYGPGQGGLVFTVEGTGYAPNSPTVDGTFSGEIGVTEHLNLEASIVSLSFGPKVRYLGGSFIAWYNFLDTPHLEIDSSAAIDFSDDPVLRQARPGVHAVIRVAHELRLDTATELLVPLHEGSRVGVSAPLLASLQVTRYHHVTVGSGVLLENPGLDTMRTSIPLSLAVGWSVPAGRLGYFVLRPSVTWPHLGVFGAAAPAREMVVGTTVALVML